MKLICFFIVINDKELNFMERKCIIMYKKLLILNSLLENEKKL